jgi:hypothetical protein
MGVPALIALFLPNKWPLARRPFNPKSEPFLSTHCEKFKPFLPPQCGILQGYRLFLIGLCPWPGKKIGLINSEIVKGTGEDT